MMRIITASLLFVFALLSGGCESKVEVHQQQILALGTLVDVVIYGVDQQQGQAAVDKVSETLEAVHHDWHAWQPSQLTAINQKLAAGEVATLTPVAQQLMAQGIELSIKSNHLFNPAAGKLIELWGFHSDDRNDAPPPATEAVNAWVAQQPRMADLTLEGNKLSSTNPAVQLDVGGYAKGYAVDLAITALRQMGVEHAIVNAGGDLRAIGNKNGIPWHVGIRNPRGTGVIAALDIEGDESVFTSGDYERYFDYEGQRYHHILDPRSGYPATGASSVTVVHRDATVADAAATALLIAGPDQWFAIAQAMGVTQVMLIDHQGTAHMTKLMAQRLKILIEPAPPINIVDL